MDMKGIVIVDSSYKRNIVQQEEHEDKQTDNDEIQNKMENTQNMDKQSNDKQQEKVEVIEDEEDDVVKELNSMNNMDKGSNKESVTNSKESSFDDEYDIEKDEDGGDSLKPFAMKSSFKVSNMSSSIISTGSVGDSTANLFQARTAFKWDQDVDDNDNNDQDQNNTGNNKGVEVDDSDEE